MKTVKIHTPLEKGNVCDVTNDIAEISSVFAQKSSLKKGIFSQAKEDDSSMDISFEEIVAIEKSRKFIQQQSYWTSSLLIISRITGTIFPTLMLSVQFWISMATFLIIRTLILTKAVRATAFPSVSLDAVGIVGAIMSFFLVFFISEVLNRYQNQFRNSMTVQRLIIAILSYFRTESSMQDLHRVLRYLTASHVLLYAGLSAEYNMENFFDPLNQHYKLLNTIELKQILDVDVANREAYNIPLSWIIDIASAQIRSGGSNERYEIYLFNVADDVQMLILCWFWFSCHCFCSELASQS